MITFYFLIFPDNNVARKPKNQMSFHQLNILLIDFLFYKLKKRSILDTILPKYDKIIFTPLLLFINSNRIFRFLFATLGSFRRVGINKA